MRRREMLATTGAAVLGLSTFPFGWTAAAEKKKQKMLYFTRSAGSEHDAVKRNGDQLAFSEKTLMALANARDSRWSAARTAVSLTGISVSTTASGSTRRAI